MTIYTNLFTPPPLPESVPSRLTTEEKVTLFRRLFRGRTDVYPVRWESKAGKSDYTPARANEWRPGVCEKPRIKCSDYRRPFRPRDRYIVPRRPRAALT